MAHEPVVPPLRPIPSETPLILQPVLPNWRLESDGNVGTDVNSGELSAVD